jgi:NitT/TauT family transport system ATP-binding protein
MAEGSEQVAGVSKFTVRIDRKAFAGYLAISGVEFEVKENEFVCLLGPSGSGKTTTLNIIAGLDCDFTGEVRFSEPNARSRLAYLFQNPRLLPWRTLLENTRLPIKDRPDATAIAKHWLDRVGLRAFHDLYPGHASLGMQRLAALARAFATEPSLLLMDEPFVSLDQRNADELRELLVKFWRGNRVSTLMVTHDVEEAMRLATRILVYSAAPARVVADIPVVREAEPDRLTSYSETAIRRELNAALAR